MPNIHELKKEFSDAQERTRRRVLAALTPENDGQFVAIDLATGEFEIDSDDYTAVMRLSERRPSAQIWLELAGRPTAQVIRAVS